MNRHINKMRMMMLGLMLFSTSTTQAIDTPITSGIKTDFGDVLIENLGIGRTYNLRDLAGTPLKVTNTSDRTVDMVIDVTIPKESMIMGTRRLAGFKPIPSVNWVKLSQTQFVVPPNESAYTDVIIDIPDDKSLFGKKFQASIYSRTTGKNLVQVGVWSHLLITILPDESTQAEAERKQRHGATAAEYTLLPDKLEVMKAPIGQKIDIAKFVKKTIKIANSGTTAIKLHTQVVPIGDTPLGLQSGFEEPKTGWLRMKSEEITVEPDSFGDMGLTLELPNDPKLKQKQLMFVIKVQPADADVVGVTFYGKVYVIVE